MQLPSTITGLIVWAVALIIVCLVAVFLFTNIVLPLLDRL